IAHGVQDAVYAWQTTIFLTNPAAVGSGAVSGSITFTAPNGTPFELAFVDEAGQQSSGAAIGFQIAGGQTKKYVSTGNVPLVSGFATVRTASGVVSGAALFTQFKNGILFAEAGVSASAKVLRQAVIVDTTGG